MQSINKNTPFKKHRSFRIAIVLIVLVLITIILFSMLVTSPGERLMRNLIERRLSRELSSTVHVGKVETNLFDRIQIWQVEILHSDGSRAVKLGYGRMNYRLWNLLRSDLTFDALYLDSLVFVVRRDSTGQLETPFSVLQKTGEPEVSPQVKIQLKKLQISNSSVSYNDLTIPIQSTVNTAAIEYSQTETGEYHWTVMTDAGEFNYGEIRIPEIKLSAAGKVSNDRWEIQDLDFSTPYLDVKAQVSGIYLKKDSRFTLDTLEIAMLGGRIHGDGHIQVNDPIDHQLSLNIEGLELATLFQTFTDEPVSNRGMLSGKWNSSGPLRSMKEVALESNMSIKQAHYQEKYLPDLNIRLLAELGKTSILLNQAENRLQCDFRFDDGILGGTYLLDINQLQPLAELMNVKHLSGVFQGKGRINGEIKNPNISMEIQGRTLRYYNFPIDSFQLSGEYREKQVFIQNGKFSGQYVSGQTPLPIPDSFLLKGGFSYRGSISGTVDDPRGEIYAKLGETEFRENVFQYGDLHITAGDGQIILDHLSLGRDSLLILAYGQYRIAPSQGRIDISLFEVQESGPSSFMRVHDKSDQTRNKTSLGTVKIGFNHEAKDDWVLKGAGKDIHLDKMLPLYKKNVDWKGIIGFDLDLSLARHDTHGRMQIWADAVGLGSAVLDSVRATVHLHDHRITAAPLTFYSKDQPSRAEAVFGLTGTGGGEFALTDKSEIQGWVEGNGIDLHFLTPILGRGIDLAGVCEYKLEWNGQWGAPHISGILDVTDGRFRAGSGSHPVSAIEAKLSLADSVLDIHSISGIIQENPFSIKGRMATQDWEYYRMSAELILSDIETLVFKGWKSADSLNLIFDLHDLPLALFQNTAIGIDEMDGRVNSKLDIAGQLASPRLFGFVELREVTGQLPTIGQPISDGFVKATFENDKIVLDSLFFKMDKGTVLAEGHTRLVNREIKSLDALIAVDNVRINRKKQFSFGIQSIRAGIKMVNSGLSLDGDIILNESRLVRDVQVSALLASLQKVEQQGSTPPSLLRKMRLDLRIRESDKVWVDNNIAKLRLHAELGIIGTLAQPALTGRVSVEEGYVLYLDRKFRVQQGILDFIDPFRINPIMDFKAQADIKSFQTWSSQPYTVSINIQGPLDQTVFAMSSNPPLDRADIVTLLTMGATRQELRSNVENGKSTFGDVLKDRVGHLSSSQISGFASRRLGNLFGLEDMTIQGNLFQFGKSWGPQLFASKKITDRMEISYTTRVGHSNEQSIRLDYKLTKVFAIEGETDQQGRSGIDLKFRWKFK